MSAPPAAKRRKIGAGESETPVPIPVVKSKSNELYDRCVEAKHVGDDFTIKELQDLKVSDNSDELGELCQDLMDRHLFILYTRRGGAIYKLRSKDEALKIARLSSDNGIIYNQIAGAGRNGIWKKTLSNKSNLHENTVTKGLKELLSKKLVKEFKTNKNPTKRMYVLSHLEPSEDSTGGSFYREGELDEGLVNTLCHFIVAEVEHTSWAEQKGSSTDKGKGRSHSENRTRHGGDRPIFRTMKSRNGHPLVPQSSDFNGYPSTEDILNIILEAELLKDYVLKIEDVQQLVQQLIYDGRLEEMSPGHYRSVRRVWTEKFHIPNGTNNQTPGPAEIDEEGYGPGNGLSQVPCGRCPVATDCRVGGTIGPDNCVYLDKWLEF